MLSWLRRSLVPATILTTALYLCQLASHFCISLFERISSATENLFFSLNSAYAARPVILILTMQSSFSWSCAQVCRTDLVVIFSTAAVFWFHGRTERSLPAGSLMHSAHIHREPACRFKFPDAGRLQAQTYLTSSPQVLGGNETKLISLAVCLVSCCCRHERKNFVSDFYCYYHTMNPIMLRANSTF